MDESYVKKKEILSSFLGQSDKYKEYQLLFYCPNCHHHKKKLSVNLEKEIFNCWVCHFDLDPNICVNLIRKYGTSNNLEEWKKVSRVKYNTESFEDTINNMFGDKIEKKEKHEIVFNEEFVPIRKDLDALEARKAINYLKKRKFDLSIILKYNIHFVTHGYYSNRIVIPSYNDQGKINYFLARSIFDIEPKYLYPIAKKSEIIFNDLFVCWEKTITLVEGFFDSVKVENSIPLLGSTVNEESLLFKKIMKYKPKVNLMLDNDYAGRQALVKISEFLSHWDIDLYYVSLGDYKDPGDMKNQQAELAVKNSKRINSMLILDKALE